jgi:hypothetical protein
LLSAAATKLEALGWPVHQIYLDLVLITSL